MSTRRGLPCQGRVALAHGSLARGGASAGAGAGSLVGAWSLDWDSSTGGSLGSTAGAGTSAAAIGSSLTGPRYPLLGWDRTRENPADVRKSEDQGRFVRTVAGFLVTAGREPAPVGGWRPSASPSRRSRARPGRCRPDAGGRSSS